MEKEIGNDYTNVYNKYLHTLGNLTITGHNSELGTKSFNEKKKMIKELSKAKKLNSLILQSEHWNETSIIKRGEALARFAIKIFAIEETEILNKSYVSNNVQIYNLNDQDTVIGTTPDNYTFYGENISVKSYANMLSSMLDLLYNYDSKIIDELAKKRFKVTSSGRIYITTEKSEIRRAKEIGNTGIYYEANLSAGSILQFIKKLIEVYGMEPDEFEFICK